MGKMAIFVIKKVGVDGGMFATGFEIKSEEYSAFNKYNIHRDSLFECMTELKNAINNELGLDVVFEVK